MEAVKEKFLRYVSFDTMSEDNLEQVPSTEKQFKLAKQLKKELEEMGADDVRYDAEHCYVYGKIPATDGGKAPCIGFIAHMDTSPALSGANVRPGFVPCYDGGDIVLNSELGIVMAAKDFPALQHVKGQELIVTDGTTLLGADDKAGVAEIMAMAEYLLEHKEIKHGEIAVGFTPDEEVGNGVAFFDIPGFGAKYAYTIDGGELGELENETFNAASARVTVNGKSIHPGEAKDKMVNSLLVAMELEQMLPQAQKPMYTCDREGFYHLDEMNGTVEKTEMVFILRDHDAAKLEERKRIFKAACAYLNAKYGEGTVDALVQDSYRNMGEVLKDYPELTEIAAKAMRAHGVEPVIKPIRGGTDGSNLSFKGLPCPNLCTGGFNFHGKYECVSVEAMEEIVKILVTIAELFAE